MNEQEKDLETEEILETEETSFGIRKKSDFAVFDHQNKR